MASGPCEMPDHLDYCVWGTYGLDNTVSNSRSVPIETGIQQIFTPVTGDMTTVQLEFQSTSIGKLIDATEATDPQAICVQMSIASTDGIPLSTMAYTVKSTTGIRQRVKVPLQNAMIKGVRNALTLQKGPACLSKDLTTMVAMSSKYKYPAKYGSLKINGQKSMGSLWAVID